MKRQPLLIVAIGALSISLVVAAASQQNRAGAVRNRVQPLRRADANTPGGLVVVLTNDPGKPVDVSPISNSAISGAALQIHWSDIEPTDPASGPPDWSRIEAVLSAAKASNKWVQLLIFAGFFSPPWALKGVEQEVFPLQYGPGHGTKMPLPMPWDPVYLSRWSAFVKLLSEKFGGDPALRVVGAGGPTSVSAEFTLPGSEADMVLWKKHNYTPTKYKNAWKQMFQTYAADFPNQFVSLSLGSGIRINDKGENGPRQPLLVRDAVVAQALATLGSRFVLQGCDLDGFPITATSPSTQSSKATAFIISYNGQAVTGFQLRSACMKGSAGMGVPKNPQQAMINAFDNGMQLGKSGKHVNYIEVYFPDVVPQMQAALDNGAARFSGPSGPPIIPKKLPPGTKTPPA